MGWPFGTRKKQSAYEPGPKDKIQAKLSRTRQPGAFSTIDRGTQALAEQQKPQDVQNLAEEEEPPAPPSLLTLREVYKHYHVEDSIEPKDRDVAAYVQALDSERESAMTQAQVFQKNHDSLWAQVRSLRSSVRSVIAEKDPSSRAENLENMPAYIGRLLDRVQNQAEVIDQKVVQIVELNTESRNQKTIHAQQIKAQENTHILKQQELEEELEEERQAELRRKENAHKKAVATLEDAHKDAIARLDATIATLQSGLLTVGSRFQSLTDSDCKSRFGLIRTLVHSLGPSPPVIDAHGYGDLFDRAEFVRNTKGDHFMYLLDASIWRILFDGIFSSPFRVFGKQGEKFTSSWEQLFGAGDSRGSIESWPEPDSRSEEWRYTTVEILRRSLSHGGPPGSLHQLKESYETNLREVRDAIAGVLAKVSSEDKTNEIRKIVDKSCSLALDFGIQRCRIQLFAPCENKMISLGFTSDTVIDLNESNKSASGGVVLLVVKPGLRKSGDGRVGSLDTIKTLWASEVYLERSNR